MTLTLFQYNTHLFTGTLAEHAPRTVYEDARRREGIIAALTAAPPDLVALEEVWSAASQRAFIAAGEMALPFFRTDGIDSPFSMGSGLVMLSRHELRTDPDPARVPLPGFTPFTDATGSDAAAAKGYLTVQVRPPGTAPFWVIHTHTQSGAEAADIAVRAGQFAQIGRTLGLIARHFGQPAIVVGDLNVIGEAGGAPTREWKTVAALLGGHGLLDGYRACHPDIAACPGLTYDGARNALIRYFAPSDAGAADRLDCVWSAAGAVAAASVDRSLAYRDPTTGTSMPLSDHFALRVTLDIG